jgi:hypothetical protein
MSMTNTELPIRSLEKIVFSCVAELEKFHIAANSFHLFTRRSAPIESSAVVTTGPLPCRI